MKNTGYVEFLPAAEQLVKVFNACMNLQFVYKIYCNWLY